MAYMECLGLKPPLTTVCGSHFVLTPYSDSHSPGREWSQVHVAQRHPSLLREEPPEGMEESESLPDDGSELICHVCLL